MMKLIGFSIFLVTMATKLAYATGLTSTPVPGGIVLIDLGPTHHAKTNQLLAEPKGYYRGNSVAVFETDGRYQAVVGIPISAKPGQHILKTSAASYQKDYQFEVKAKEYPTEHITLPATKDKQYNEPSKENIARWKREKEAVQKAFKIYSDQMPDFDFLIPVEGRESSPFGKKRIFNGNPRKAHSGLDIAAPTGTPIKAASAGKVVLTDHHFFNGKTVIIDHGKGVMTFYCHLSSIDVEQGQLVNKGDAIGGVGTTGRSTGPHLHLSVSLNNVRVDPKLFLK